MTHGHEKSRSAIVAVKPTNKAERSAAEPVERRAETKGNADQQRTRRTQRRISVSKLLARIRQHIVAVDTQGGNRMRASCTYGSVRGARGNSRPYRDRRALLALLGGAATWPLAGARAADGSSAPCGRAHQPRGDRPGGASADGGIPAGIATPGVECWTEPANRHSLDLGRRRAHSQIRSGAGRAVARCNSGHWHGNNSSLATRHPQRTNHLRVSPRSGWCRYCR